MRDSDEDTGEQSQMQREDFVFEEFFASAICAIDGRHVMRIIQEYCEYVKSNGHFPGIGRTAKVSCQQQRRGPCPTADHKVRFASIKPLETTTFGADGW